MLTWEEESAHIRGCGGPLEAYYAAIRRPIPFEPATGMFGRLDLVGVFRERFPLLVASPEVDAAIRELWPHHMERFNSVEDYDAWFRTAVEAGLERAFGKAMKRGHRAVARARCNYGRAHGRKPKCGFGGFFSPEKVNLRNAP
jgi:hypothetical protein